MMAAPETVELPESIDTPSEIELAAEPEPEPEPETLEHELPQPGLAAVDFELDFSREAPVTSTSEPEIDLQAAPVDAELPPPVTPEPAPEPVQPAAEMVVPQPVAAPVEPAAIPVFLQSAPKRRLPLWLFIPFALLLVLAAVAQTAYFLRTEIAARYPVAKPWLEQACQPLACKVELPRQAELLNIEDSDLQADPDHDGVLVLVSALYNRASYAQAYPLFELTLTDKFDKPMLRRTFTPQEYLPQGTAIQAGIAAGGEAHSRLALTVEGEKPAGYRLYVRY